MDKNMKNFSKTEDPDCLAGDDEAEELESRETFCAKLFCCFRTKKISRNGTGKYESRTKIKDATINTMCGKKEPIE